MKIIHLKNKDIDYHRWDTCISQSKNQLIYAFSWYLDVVSPNWEALISKDYEFVMPLPVKSRYGIPYLVQPVLTQQLGIFSKMDITEIIVDNFIKEIPYFSYELNLNEQNLNSKALIYPNYVLDLYQTYKEIYSSYSKNTQRNIDKAKRFNLKIKKNISVENFLSFYFSVDKLFLSPHQPVLQKLINKGILENCLTLYGVYWNENVLIAELCLLHNSNRLTYLLPVSNTEGKTMSGMFFLIDYLIRENSGNKILFDFEGSQIEGISRLFKGFGAKNHPYFILKRFRPSFLIRKSRT